MKLRVLRRSKLQRCFCFGRFDDFPGFERFARASRDQRQSQIFRQQFLFFHQNAARVHQKSGLGRKWIGDLFSLVIQAIGFAFDDPNVDFAG